ncbi:hypothetical protein [Acidianus manzaensis]|uniref:Uncharacterized protein n=1 Tax=Acidianus manzaensis TaxID=282676 RepID=A0A1W6JWW6_9CREN|nr:hypothetical protein [Acidianus manzaensis]ARM74758.1 hypothetical protein B6F84_01105 [Acidianus manzaensis]
MIVYTKNEIIIFPLILILFIIMIASVVISYIAVGITFLIWLGIVAYSIYLVIYPPIKTNNKEIRIWKRKIGTNKNKIKWEEITDIKIIPTKFSNLEIYTKDSKITVHQVYKAEKILEEYEKIVEEQKI